MKYAKLFTPVKIGNVTIKNRFAMAPMGPLGLADADGGFNQRGIDYYTERAKGGTGLIITGVTFVENEIEEHGMPNCPCSTHNPVHFVRTAREMTERIHAYNAKVFLQMSGGFGRVTIPTNLGEFPPVAPSPIQHRWLDKTCRALTTEEIRSIVKKFGEGAYNAKRAGFDGVQIHAVHEGYLIEQFAIALFNQRTDEYGGSLENRCRATTELLQRIRALCGPYFLISMQITAAFDPQWIEMLKLWDAYVDIYHVRPSRSYGEHPSTYIFPEQDPPSLEHTKALKDAGVNAVIGAACGFQDPDVIERAIEEGKCDMVFMARTYNCDPDYLQKIIQQRPEDITPCLRCDCCHSAICAVNPVFGLENVFDDMFRPSQGGKKVAVIGGGPAGMRAAMVCAQRGHQVTLFEKSGVLGGQAIHSDYVYGKWGIQRFKNWEILQCEKLGVDIRLNTEATPEMIEYGGYNAVIAATGAAPKHLDIPGGKEALHPIEVFGKEAELGKNVVIVGGTMTAFECAMYLNDNGHQVTLITRSIAANNCGGHDAMQTRRYLTEKYSAIRTIEHAQILSVDGGKAVYRSQDGTTGEVPFDSVVVNAGVRPCVDEAETFFGTAPEFYIVGDAQITRAHGMQSQQLLNTPGEFLKGNMRYANYSAFMAAYNI